MVFNIETLLCSVLQITNNTPFIICSTHVEFGAKPFTLSYDIAILELEEEVNLGGRIEIVCLPPPDLVIQIDQQLMVSGKCICI